MKRALFFLLALILCGFVQAQNHQFAGGNGSQSNPYLINNETQWNYFCNCLQDNGNWNRFSGKYVKLGANITVTTMAGSNNHDFCGTFDGDGHTLTVHYGTEENPITEQYAAPFRFVDGATIQNLSVNGTIISNTYRAAGFVGETGTTTNHITNCVSSLTISGGRYTGGFSVGGNVEIEGCVFNGKINGSQYSGGFAGYSNNNLKITNSLFAPQSGSSISGGTFYYGGGITPDNCYYTQPLGSVQGKVAYTRTQTPANIGSQSASYGNGNVIAYANGLKFNNTYYVGSDSDLTVNNAGTMYTINTAAGWNYFCAVIAENDQGYFTGKTVKLGNSITVGTMAGNSNRSFSGTFDGNSKTLTFDTEAIECDYLHLIDNATGIDIDLYQTQSYTFNSSDCNYATRFKIVFDKEATNDIVDNFAYVSNGELVINGTGTLQVFDVLGRQILTKKISTLNSQLSIPSVPGVYVLRLSNGNDVKTQKIITH